MVFLKKLKKKHYNYIVKKCLQANPADLIGTSENSALNTFHYASKNIDVYREFLAKKTDIDNLQVKSIESFKTNVPLTDKSLIYGKINNILDQMNIDTIHSILLSSGSTGTFSFGINTEQEVKRGTRFLELILDHYYNILSEKTLVINCLAVKIPNISAGAFTEIGPRIDSLLYLIQTLGHHFEQIIIIGDNYFIKNAIEEAINAGIDFSPLKVHLILGGVYLPESLREYLSGLLKINPTDLSTGSIHSSMGMSEFGFNLFFESIETIRLRKILQKNETLRKIILGNDAPDYLPMCFNYFPQAFYVEEIQNEIIITTLNKGLQIPLIRYNTKDHGKIIDYEKLNQVLAQDALNSEKLLPPFKSPLVLIFGRVKYLSVRNVKIYPAQVHDIIYTTPDITKKITGFFHLSGRDRKPKLEIQYKKGPLSIREKAKITSQFEQAFFDYFQGKLTRRDINIIVEPYARFRWGMEIDYERKFQYI